MGARSLFFNGIVIGILGFPALQAASAQTTSEDVCTAREMLAQDGGSPFLQVACGEAGAVLGRVDTFTLTQLPELDAVAVQTSLDGQERAWLLVKEGERELSVEEITATISRLQGSAGLEALNQATDVNETSALARTSFASRSSQPDQTIDFSKLVQRSRSVRAATGGGEGETAQNK